MFLSRYLAWHNEYLSSFLVYVSTGYVENQLIFVFFSAAVRSALVGVGLVQKLDNGTYNMPDKGIINKHQSAYFRSLLVSVIAAVAVHIGRYTLPLAHFTRSSQNSK